MESQGEERVPIMADVPSVSTPAERPFKVYSFQPASGVLKAFWFEECACQEVLGANTIRNLLQLTVPGIQYVVAKEPPTEIPDSALYD